jgi:hypothetical protein
VSPDRAGASQHGCDGNRGNDRDALAARAAFRLDRQTRRPRFGFAYTRLCRQATLEKLRARPLGQLRIHER